MSAVVLAVFATLVLYAVTIVGNFHEDAKDLRSSYFLDAFPAAGPCIHTYTWNFGSSYRIRFNTWNRSCAEILRKDQVLREAVNMLSSVEFVLGNEGHTIPNHIGLPVLLGALHKGRSPGATVSNGEKQTIYLLRSKHTPGVFCPQTYSHGYPLPARRGAILVHELGHAAYNLRWFRTRKSALKDATPETVSAEREKIKRESGEAALEAENAWWSRQGSNAPRRLHHDQVLGCLAHVGGVLNSAF